MTHSTIDALEIRDYDRESLARLAAPLGAAGLLPAPLATLEPAYLGAGFEGENTGALVAFAGGRAVAYMPYALRRNDFPIALGPFRLVGLPFRQLRVFGYIARGGADEKILDAFFSWFAAHKRWHVAQLFDVPEDHPLCRYVEHRSARRSYRLTSRPFDTLNIGIEREFETYLKSRFTKKSRYNLKREVRLLEQARPGPVEMKVYSAPEQAEEFLRHAETIIRRTYQWKLGLTSLRAEPFTIRRTAALARQGQWRSYILFIAGAPAAYCYATMRWGNLSYDTIGYDPRFAKLNPGKVLLYKIVEELHESRAARRLDFGRGPADYKKLFATASGRVFDVNVYVDRPYSWILRMLAAATGASHRWLRPLARPWMPVFKRRLQTLRLLLPTLPDTLEIVSDLSLQAF